MPTDEFDVTGLRVLVVDDDDGIVATCLLVLAGAGAVAFGARDAEAGHRALADSAYDVLVTDLVMPGLTGRKFLDRLGETHACIPVVVMSGVPDQVQAAASRANVRATLDKPFSATALLAAVHRAAHPVSASVDG